MKVAFNKYNAPEVLSLLFRALESAGLAEAAQKLRDLRVPQLVEQAWRGKVANISGLLQHYAMEFDSEEALKKYLEEHPGADKANHHVKKKEDGGGDGGKSKEKKDPASRENLGRDMIHKVYEGVPAAIQDVMHAAPETSYDKNDGYTAKPIVEAVKKLKDSLTPEEAKKLLPASEKAYSESLRALSKAHDLGAETDDSDGWESPERKGAEKAYLRAQNTWRIFRVLAEDAKKGWDTGKKAGLSPLERAWGLAHQAGIIRPIPFGKVPGQDPKVIEMAVNKRMEDDWVVDPRSGLYQEESVKEGFREYVLPRARKRFDETNEVIKEASARLLKRLLIWEKSSLQVLEDLDYEVKLYKPTSTVSHPDWADYDFHQKVDVTDLTFGGTHTVYLNWTFRGDLHVIDKMMWSQFYASSDPKWSFAQILMTFVNRLHLTLSSWVGFEEHRMQAAVTKGRK